ncbi:MAG: Gfo/Idh/MocA family oxidoreductase, partial [Bifidobacteriaceae bacterium]|nr:Gfo/Idh/MocA family oxidoreductase [Bifidobacteriaceae bacterium]
EAASRTAAIKVMVVGFGARGELARCVEASSIRAEVVAVIDPTPEGLVRAGGQHPGAGLFGSVREALDSGARIDAALVLSPDDTHEQVAVELLRAGVAVYLEKPMATTVAGADSIIAAARATATPAYVGHNFRRTALIQTLKSVIDQGLIGEVKTIWVRHFVGHGGDYYFKDWHADRSRSGGLLLQKASHDIDAIHHLAGAFTRRVSAMGSLMVYGRAGRRGIGAARGEGHGDGDHQAPGAIMPDWFSLENWPPAAQTGLNAVVDVEDVSLVNLELANGVLASYSQCHFTPDYWRNYTIIGSEGRAENFGDTTGGVIKVWNRRRDWDLAGDVEIPIPGTAPGHRDADQATIDEFLRLLVQGGPTSTNLTASRQAVATACQATDSLRHWAQPRDVSGPTS